MTRPLQLVLGSTSRYRRELLERLLLPFDVCAPDVDETPLPGEAPAALAVRLALAKARDVAAKFPGAVVIGADQVADHAGQSVGKPGNHERAVGQLRAMSGHSVVFQTAVAVVRADTGYAGSAVVPVNSPTIAPAARSPRRLASRCSKASTRPIRPRSLACR